MSDSFYFLGESCQKAAQASLGQRFIVRGWVHRRRDHGGVIFVDLRDRSGLLQCVFSPEQAALFQQAEALRSEWVLALEGRLAARPEGTANPALVTGDRELWVERMEILNRSKALPFSIEEHSDLSNEELRLRYRYLDLRRADMLEKLSLRAKVSAFFRDFLDQNGFLDIETPFLTKTTPGGARDYLVPSRVHPGSFFALPQSPQIFKQLLMMGGLERYYQIVRCFRDEDLRADRQPEFTQVDIETAFMSLEQVMALMEQMLLGLFQRVLGLALPPMQRLPYAEAMRRFGSDKPDLRIDLELVDVGDLFVDLPLAVFQTAARDPQSRVAVLRVPGGEALTRKQIEEYTHYVGQFGAKGLAWIKIQDRAGGMQGAQSPIVKFMTPDILEQLYSRVSAESGDILFFGADTASLVNAALGALRVKVAQDRGLVRAGWALLWITDFPLFERDEQEQRWVACHHPFTAPQDPDLMIRDPHKALARAYDVVLNGVEVGGGSMRIYHRALQKTVFDLLGISDQEAEAKFGFLLEALEYGCPPHGGIAFGLDRLVMMMSGSTSIREVIAFPKTQSSACPLSGAPTLVPLKTLKELGIGTQK